MNARRDFLKKLSMAAGAGVGLGASLYSMSSFSAGLNGYKALIVIHLNGGNDANDVIVPMDAAYADYEKSRPSIAVKKTALTQLSGNHLGHSMGLNSAMSPLTSVFNSGRLAFLVNAGALVKPTTAADVLSGKATLPPFLYSHPEQSQYVQGWMGDEDPSGWGGRAIEALGGNASLKAPLIALSSSNGTLVLGQRSRIVNANTGNSRYLGSADLTDSNNRWTQILESLTRLQSATNVEAEYARTFRGAFLDTRELAVASKSATEPAATFKDTEIGRRMRFFAQTLPFYKASGSTRQVYFTEWGSFDTHANQRNSNVNSGNADQDTQLADLADALAAFDKAISAAGMGNEVAVFVTSEFNRTLDPAAGLGSDHAWGSHWMVMGGQVNGGKLYGDKFPSLVLGGVDDAHNGKRGYWVPQMSSDQVAADLLMWLGLPQDKLTEVMPNLKNFVKKNVGFMNG
ncbi:DUF1501 domain-containing protein [Limnohabitans sp. Hippo4]|uniref:DUF1501 domain-containing protein n=1 Tax=Limnohabitans sp. Hippo4 TaxID=1826167 RepID=UPI000D3404EE|nr:DUF1501 domain-containing protein [Limnohabitans sp. Hippo4]PUE34183.1 hypothetical protein B9Z46_13220 [Limnohabitans sp. Hippo4]